MTQDVPIGYRLLPTPPGIEAYLELRRRAGLNPEDP